MFNKELLEKCSNTCAVSGFESAMVKLFCSELSGCGEISADDGDNIYCHIGEASPSVGFMAHMDEIGFMVQGVTPDGFLLIVPLGGWWNHTLPSQRMLVQTRDGRTIPGQIGTKPPHLLPEGERRQVMADTSLFVDIGASSAEEVASLGIRPGCSVVPDVELQPLAVPHRWMGKAFDNRAGVYCMLQAMKRLAADAPKTLGVTAIGTVQEEVGTRGARAIPKANRPTLAIILEGPPADDTFGQSSICRQGVLGKGVQIRLYDPTNITRPSLADFVIGVAEKHHIPHQITVRRTGGTDAAASYPQWNGTPAIVLGVPVRYIHSHNGILDDRDLQACEDLAVAIVRELDGLTDKGAPFGAGTFMH